MIKFYPNPDGRFYDFCLVIIHGKRNVSTNEVTCRQAGSTSEAIQHPPNISPPSDQPPLAFQDEIE